MRMSSGPSKRKEKPRAGLVELPGGDAEIEGDAVDGGEPVRRQQLREIAEAAVQNGEPVRVAGDQGAGAGERLGVAVDADDPARRRGEQRLAIAAAAEGGVEVNAARTRRQRQQHFFQQHRPVPVRRGGHASPRSRRSGRNVRVAPRARARAKASARSLR